jgi:Arc/MetJ-type ribon-helix-helix transcriptional regulator
MANFKLIDTSRPKGGETEKITINLGPIDLGQIDLLVEEGFYSNRTDLIRTAIRNQLSVHAQVLTETVTRRALVLGLQHFSKEDLEAARAANEQLDIHVLGLASIAADRIGRGAWRISCVARSQGSARRPHPVAAPGIAGPMVEHAIEHVVKPAKLIA